MTSSSFLDDPGAPIVTDASVIINLVATRAAAEIVDAFPNRFLVTTHVRRELWEGRGRGHGSWKGLEALIADGSIEPVELQRSDEPVYRSLVEGEAVKTLDDGEAATIAHAATHRPVRQGRAPARVGGHVGRGGRLGRGWRDPLSYLTT